MSNNLLVFGWHNVTPSWSSPFPLRAGLRRIERQFRLLGRVAHVVPLEPALNTLAAGGSLPPRAVALTFDDGYRDNLEVAVPLLERLGLSATFFLVPGLLSGLVQPWWEVLAWAFARTGRDILTWEDHELRLNGPASYRSYQVVTARLKRRDRANREASVQGLIDLLEPVGSTGDLFLDWDGARQLVRRGFAIGSHSMYHAILTQEQPEEQARDLSESRRLLQEELSHAVELLAYPNGTVHDYDATTIAMARRAGYAYGITAQHGRNGVDTPAFEIRRFTVRPERGAHGLAVVLPVLPTAYRAFHRLIPRRNLHRPMTHENSPVLSRSSRSSQ